ncbi:MULTISPECIES: zinc-ribbon domain-containing protein [unclassified Frigoribacterium]|uniref:zinc-ribbon domain-containing protein n=1 Tax=unclassified Frigoribacterium TaxID=2627005 RepID=UPI0006FB70EB|nr:MULTISPECIES: zinc-ribbon domain-containing protein [unclassified Frigoribacterium]
MYCPTCASPLPVGAMFCGECGRAVSSADLAAARRRADAAAEHVDATSAPDLPEAPSRATSHPRRGDAEPPWWVRDRQTDADAAEVGSPGPDHPRPVAPESVPEPPAWPVDDRSVERAADVDPRAASEEARAESPRPSRPDRPAIPDGQVGALGTAAPEAVEPPVPLRSPAEHPDNGPRPTSAPLWTASLTPLRSDDTPPVATTAAETPSSEVPDVRPDDEVGFGEAAPSSTPDGARPAEADHAHGADGPEAAAPSGEPAPASAPTPEVAPDDRAAAPVSPPPLVRPTADVPRDGDTAPVAALGRDFRPPIPDGSRPAPVESGRPAPVPLVEPAPLVPPGSAVGLERCTHCGAAVDEDDIFCGECGAVVQSVALSFTGPVVPLPPEWRPDDESVLRRGPATEDGEAVRSGTGDAGTGDAGTGQGDPGSHDGVPAQGEADDQQQAAPRPAPEPIDHVPGFRAERPAVTPRPTVADVPPAPTSSSAPPWRPRRPPVDLPVDDDVDETRIVRRGGLGTEYVLQFSTGESITVDGTGLVGRAPTPQPGERFDQLVRIVDPGKSVSKTHLEFGQEAGALWVSDRWSGNGTVVRPRDLPPRRADPGVRVRVTRGTRVEIGEQFFVVV